MKLVRPIVGGIAVLGVLWACKTVPTAQQSSSAVRDATLSGMSEEDRRAWDPCGGAERLSTAELQQRIQAIAAISAGQMTLEQAEERVGRIYQIDPERGAQQFRIDTETFLQEGGMFDLRLKGNGNPLLDGRLVQDNSFRYVWDLNSAGKFLPPGTTYNHIIPQYNDVHQPDMIKYLKEGDIIVYFHPEYRGGGVSNHEQWRATHAAVIQEVPSDDPSTPCKLQTIDVPAGYARPFDGNSTTPFHVFRMVARDKDASGRYKQYDEDKNFWLRSQISRWGSLAFDKHPFNGYQVFDMRFPSSSVIDAQYVNAYLTQEPLSELGMYCAWFVFANANLAWTRPMNNAEFARSNMSSIWGPLYSGERTIGFEGYLQQSHMAGDGTISKYYALPQEVVSRYADSGVFKFKNEFAFEPMTAPEMALGFLDKVVGPDYDLLLLINAMRDKLQDGSFGAEDMARLAGAYMQHMNLKLGMITQMREQMTGLFEPESSMANLYLLNQDPRIPQENDETIRDTVVQEYTGLIGQRYDYIIKRYQRALSVKKNASGDRINFAATGPEDQQRLMGELQGADPQVVISSMSGFLHGIRGHIYGLIQKERSGHRDYQHDFSDVATLVSDLGDGQEDLNDLRVFGKKWVPPYMYVRVAENHEAFYMNTSDAAKHRPRLVYVGTVVPSKFLGAETAIKDVELSAEEQAVAAAVQERFGGSNLTEATTAMVTALAQMGDAGFNDYEAQALRTMRQHWNPDASSPEDIAMHNRYGIGPNLFLRILVNYWNAPTDPSRNIFRPAIYEGAVSSIAGAAENLRLLQQDPVTQMAAEQAPVQDNPQVHARRVSVMPCIAMQEIFPSETSDLCPAGG